MRAEDAVVGAAEGREWRDREGDEFSGVLAHFCGREAAGRGESDQYLPLSEREEMGASHVSLTCGKLSLRKISGPHVKFEPTWGEKVKQI